MIRMPFGGTVLLSALLFCAGPGAAQPAGDGAVHLGVQTCAGSTCHGAVQPWQNSTVRQNEFTIWSTHDAHAGAYAALRGERARAMAAKLGIGPAHEAGVCLDCHTDNVPAARRGKNFDIADGVGCESCHGGAERWLGVHVSGTASHADTVAAGMYPTDDPVARAELCIGCHQPNPDRLVGHRLMAAGHPRLVFELDTFSVNQPRHAAIDEDYRQRKQVTDSANLWAIGQAVAARQQLAALRNSMRSGSHLFPELSHFECHSCHHAFSEARWRAQPGVGLGPGEPQLYDANLVMLAAASETLDPALADRLRQQTRDLHRATRRGAAAVADATEALAQTVRGAERALRANPIDAAAVPEIMRRLVAEPLVAEYADYGAAEQATMALAALGEAAPQGRPDLARLYGATENPDRYDPGAFAAALAELRVFLDQ